MKKIYDEFIKLAMAEPFDENSDFLRLKKDLCKKLGVQPPTNADLREHYEKLVNKKEVLRNLAFEKRLMTKKVRTESGVAVVAVLTKSYPCPGKCIYCPTEAEMPKSYLSNEPAVMRAISAKFNPYRQVQNRLRALELNGHSIEKIELIVMGGTFSYFPKNYQTKFIQECFRACNDYSRYITYNMKHVTQHSLEKEQKKNEKAQCRIIGLTLETRPDYINDQEIVNFRRLGCTRVELGVQSVFDDVLKLNRRGHDVARTIEATKLLKDAGFKINYHIMPGLPGSNLKRDYQMFQELFGSPYFQPDMLKIYPTVVTKNTKLHSMWKKGQYVPLGDQEFEKFVLKIKKNIIPPYVRIARLVRDVPTSSIIAGPIVSNLRQLIEKASVCPCIRCREVKSDYVIDEEIVLDRIDYPASDGTEIFLQYVSPASTRGDSPRFEEISHQVEAGDRSSTRGGPDKKKLFSLLRLRIPNDNNYNHPIPALKNSALIREVHTYGKLTAINTSDKVNFEEREYALGHKNSPQHIGLGKKLLLEAERIARDEFSLSKIAVISGVGVRDYYRKAGYKLRDTYLVKKL